MDIVFKFCNAVKNKLKRCFYTPHSNTILLVT